MALSTENYGFVSKEGSNKVYQPSYYINILSCEKQQFLEQVPSDHQWEPLHPETKEKEKESRSKYTSSIVEKY